MSIDTPIYIDTSSTIDNTNNRDTTSNSNTTMGSPVGEASSGPIHINEDHPDTIHLEPNRPIHINTEQTPESKSPADEFRYTDQQRLEESFNSLKSEIPKEHHGALQNFWDKVLGPTIAQGVINPLMDPMMLMGMGRGKQATGAIRKLPDVVFPSEVQVTEAKRGSYSGSYSGTETMPQQQQAFLTYAKAAGLDSNKMLEAMAMKDAGKSPDAIYKKTGAELYEGKWGERVPYSGMELKVKPDVHDSYFLDSRGEFLATGKQDHFYNIPKETTLGELITHEPLFKADPTTKDIRVRSMTPVEQERYSQSTFGFAEVSNNTIVLRPNQNEQQFKRSIAHEAEHIIQERHGLPQGSSEEMFRGSEYRKTVAEGDPDKILMMDITNQRKYRTTKGEVAARVAEDEVSKTAEEVALRSYVKTLDKEIPAKRRIDSPLDVGFPTGQDFGSIYRHEGHYITPDQAKKLYDTRPDLRPIPPGFSEEKLKSVGSKQYLELVDYLKKDSTYNAWRRKGTEGDFPSNPQLQRLLKKLGIQE